MKYKLILQKETSYYTCYPTTYYFLTCALIKNEKVIVNINERVKKHNLISRLQEIFDKEIRNKIDEPAYLECHENKRHRSFLPRKNVNHTFANYELVESNDLLMKPERFKSFWDAFLQQLYNDKFVEPHKHYHEVNHPRI